MKTKPAKGRRWPGPAPEIPDETYEQVLFQVVHKGILLLLALCSLAAIGAECFL